MARLLSQSDTRRRPTGSADRRRVVCGAVALGAALLAGCSRPGPVKVGFLGGLSGRVSDLGVGGRNGAQLAVEQANEQGGVDGRRVELLIADDEQSADVARRRLAELFDAGVAFVVGPMTSSVAVAVVPIADRRGIPLVSPTSATHELSGKADLFFRVVTDAPSAARQMATYVRGRGVRRLVTVQDLNNRAFTASWTDAAAAQFTTSGGEQVGSIDFEAAPGLRYTELARAIVAAQGDAVMIAASAADCALLVQQIRRLDTRVLVALSSWAGTEQLPQLGGRALDGVLVQQLFDRGSQAAAYLAFARRFRERFGTEPGYPAVNAHDATTLGLQAVRGSAAAGSVAQALRALRHHPGLQRDIRFDEFGDSQESLVLTELRNGAYAALTGT